MQWISERHAIEVSAESKESTSGYVSIRGSRGGILPSMKPTTAIAMGILALALGACRTSFGAQRSESVVDETAGLNGGFEVVRSGLPANWLLYTPKTIPTGDYTLVVDTTEFKDGKQSLKFDVRSCSPDGGWHSPGLSTEIDVTPGATYRVGFWIKNDGAEFVVKVGGESAKKGQYETIVKTRDTSTTWRHYEKDYTIPTGANRLRFEMNVTQPGTFWIDAVTIEAATQR